MMVPLFAYQAQRRAGETAEKKGGLCRKRENYVQRPRGRDQPQNQQHDRKKPHS